MHFTKQQAQDVDESPVAQLIATTNSHNDTFSQEIRLNQDAGRLHWVSGLYYLNMKTTYNQALGDEHGNGVGQVRIFGEAPGSPSLEGAFKATLNTSSYAVFGQSEFGLSDHWSLVTGLRLIQEKKRYTYVSGLYINANDSVVSNLGDPVGAFLPNFAGSTAQSLWTGKWQLEYRPARTVLIYAGLNRGVKAGSFNAPLSAVLTRADYVYKPEKLLSYESGVKATFLDQTLRVNASTYYYDYKDYQAFVLKNVSGSISNVNAYTKGAEIEIQAQPLPQLTVSLSGATIDATIPHYVLATGVVRNVTPAFTPKSKWSALLRYELSYALWDGRLSVQVDATQTARFFENLQNYASLEADAYLLTNARLTWSRSHHGKRWDLSAFVNNSADVRNKTTGVDLSSLCGCSEQAYGDPRWFGIEARVAL